MPAGDPNTEAVVRFGTSLTVYSDDNDYENTRSGEPGYRLERDADTVRARTWPGLRRAACLKVSRVSPDWFQTWAWKSSRPAIHQGLCQDDCNVGE